MAGEVATRGLPAPIQASRRWPGERTHAWANQYGKLRSWTERRRVLVGFWLAMAAAAIVCGRPGGNAVDVQVQIVRACFSDRVERDIRRETHPASPGTWWMTDPQLDLTTQLGSTLRVLDTLIEGELRPQIAEAVNVARRMLATSREPFGWRFIDLGARTLPDGIRSAAVFVLPAGTTPPGHHHPNSVQHMRVLAGRAAVTLRSREGTAQHDPVRYGVGTERPWLVIPQGVVHQLEVLPEGELVVLSFHTVAEEDLLEVSVAGERTYTHPAEA